MAYLLSTGTSEDINNLSYALMFTEAREQVLRSRFIALIDKLAELSQVFLSVAVKTSYRSLFRSTLTLPY